MEKSRAFLVILLSFFALLAFNAFNATSRGFVGEVEPSDFSREWGDSNPEQLGARLGKILAVKTLTGLPNKDVFLELHALYEKLFPAVHNKLKREIVNEYSLLFSWEGSDKDLLPISLYSHMDVVPVLVEDLKYWESPPFAGKIYKKYVYGRGALDIKVTGGAIFEALEKLVEVGFTPTRTIFFALGHDEETGGFDGAKFFRNHLANKGISRLDVHLDEGGLVLVDPPLSPGNTVALVGTSEKGQVTVDLTVDGFGGGHSSMPQLRTPIGRLAAAIVALETFQFPPNLDAFIETGSFLLSDMPLHLKAVFANAYLLAPLLSIFLQLNPQTNAMIRTTTSPTMLKGSESTNVIPLRPSVTINFRIIPGETSQTVVERVRETIADEKILVTVHNDTTEPSIVTRTNTPEWEKLTKTIKQVMPDVSVAPMILLGATDSVHFVNFANHVFRFAPIRYTSADIDRVHSNNERIHVESYLEAIKFYFQFMINFAG